jgi:hypothetical protein
MSDIIDINVGETIEEVTINVTDNLITVNINKVTGGGGGTQTLAQTLDLGNVTGGENITISNGDAIILDNGSMLKKGTIDAGNGGAKGISQICGVGYEHKWEAGRLYIMNDGGTTIREVSHNFTITPTATDDVTKGFVQNTRWILDNGDVYVCTDATEDAAVWELVTIDIPTLQQVTDVGSETTQSVKVIEADIKATELGKSGLRFFDLEYEGNTTLTFQETSTENTITLKAETGTVALLSDIPSSSTFVPYTGATANVDLGTHKLLAEDLDINHTSGSGVAASITKGGSGEALTVVKTSGSGNAASITGGVTLLDELHLTTDLADTYIASAATWNAKFTLPALTSGSVLFSNGTTIAQDNANLFWDDTNNRLGIGATSPQARLDVRAQGALSTDIAFRVRNSANTANLIQVQGNSNVKIGNTPYSDPSSALIIGINGVEARGSLASDNPYQDFSFINTSVASGNINNWSFGQRRDTYFGNTLGSFQIVGAYTNNSGAGSMVSGGFRVPLICNPNGDVIIAGASANAINGNVLIGTSTGNVSAKVQIDSTTQGFLPPRMTTTQKNAIASPIAGLVVYDSTLGKLCVRTASTWETITSI